MKAYVLIILSALFIFTSCGGRGKSDSDTQKTVNDGADSAAAISSADQSGEESYFYLTSEGIGPVRIGDKVNSLPASVEGLYTDIARSNDSQGMEYAFRTNRGISFIAHDYLEGTIDLIILESDDVKVKSENGSFGLGDSFDNVLALPGLTTEWYSREDNGHGLWYWKSDGLWFTVDQEKLTPALQMKLYSSDHAPEASDFDQSVKIGYIATGVPF